MTTTATNEVSVPNVPAEVIDTPPTGVDTPRRRHASPIHARLVRARMARGRMSKRRPGQTRGLGARIVGMSALAHALRPLRPDGRAYSLKTAERVVDDLVELDQSVEKVPAPRVWDEAKGKWTRPHCNGYRLITPPKDITAGRADTTCMSDRSPNGEPRPAAAGLEAKLVECRGCGAPFKRGAEPPDRLCRPCRDS